MFNEAFWFFWVVEIVDRFITLFAILAGFSVAGLVICLIVVDDCARDNTDDKICRDWILWKRWVFSLLAIGFVSMVLAMAVPPATAFYAGAGQYIAETEELDDTLRNLKTVLDAKLEELADE